MSCGTNMGHPSARVVSSLPDIFISVSASDLNKACDVCLRAKQTRDWFPLSMNKTSRVFELIHTNLWGPYRTPSFSGARYFLTIVDDYSRGVWLYLLNDKTEAPIHLRNFVAMAERQFEVQVKAMRSDNGSEFVCLTEFFQQKGIIHETSCVGTAQQNGRVERKHRHILNGVRALKFQVGLPIEFWGECVLTAGYLINRTPSSVLDSDTPYEILYKQPPNMIICVFLGLYVMLIIKYAMVTSLLLEEGVACSWDILMVRRDGDYSIWKNMNFSFEWMFSFQKKNFLTY